MSPGNVEFAQVVATMLVVPSALAAILVADERRLSGPRLDRAWPRSTRDTVIFASWQLGVLFGCPALLVWFVRTRRSAAGAALGLAWAGALLGMAVAASVVPELLIDWLGL